jgi:hypothetical protein
MEKVSDSDSADEKAAKLNMLLDLHEFTQQNRDAVDKAHTRMMYTVTA